MVSSITGSRPGPDAAKQPQTITLPCLTVGMMFFLWNEMLFCLIGTQNICPKVLGIIKIFLANVRRAFVFFLVSSGFCLRTLPWRPFFSLSYCWIMDTELHWGKWGLQFFRCCSGFFYYLLDESSLRSWSNFGKPGTPGKVHHCSKFASFVDNSSDHGSLESQSLGNGFMTLSRLIHVNYFVSHLLLNFFRSHDVLLFEHASLCQTGSISVISWINGSGSNQA